MNALRTYIEAQLWRGRLWSIKKNTHQLVYILLLDR